MRYGSVLVLAAACSANHAAPDALAGDAPLLDAALAIDATPDAPPDADASPQPACTTAPKLLIDTSPRQIGTIARSGNTLYVAAWEVTNTSAGFANPAIIAIDLVTEASTTYATTGTTTLSTGDGDAYASESSIGTLWTLHDGAAPVATVQSITAGPGAATSEGGYLYWYENMNIVRRPSAGGSVDTLVTCPSPRSLVVVGTQLYCEFAGIVQHSAKTGGMQMPIYGQSGFSITSNLVPAAGKIYYTTVVPMPAVVAIDTTTYYASTFDQLTTGGQYAGLAASNDYFYIADGLGLRRLDRTTHQSDVIAPVTGGSQGDPVLWNGQVYFETADPQAPGMRHVMHCVD